MINSYRNARRRQAKNNIKNIIKNSNLILIIHYSCESFYKNNLDNSPRITSIAVRDFMSGQTYSFSISLIAEEKQIRIENIKDHYDELEKEMLDEFYKFIENHQEYTWIHWNMRDTNFGFTAIDHRYKKLGGNPVKINDAKKFDLSRCLVDIFGVSYIGHPRLASLIKKNKITDKDFLTGEEEAKAFENKQYIKLHQSTLRKVDTLANIFERLLNGSLKTNANFFELYGIDIKAYIEIIRKHWIISLCVIAGAILGLFLKLNELFKIFP